MYKIYADDTLIYDSTIDDYKIARGEVTKELGKSGSFVFSLYPTHFYYDKFVKMKTIIKVLKDNKIVFRGRVLKDETDYFNNKNITCEGELSFLCDSLMRPYNFSGSVATYFRNFINTHNSQVDESKRFILGDITVTGSATEKEEECKSVFDNITSHILEGTIFITHSLGIEETPTIHLLNDFEKQATQSIEFGKNLKDFNKSVDGSDIITALVPYGKNNITIGNPDYVYNQEAVDRYGWIFGTIKWDDVSNASTLRSKAIQYLNTRINLSTSIDLTAIDLHLLDRNIESFELGDYIKVISEPHNINTSMVCNKQTIDLLRPDNDSITLGYVKASFTEMVSGFNKAPIISIKDTINDVSNKVDNIDESLNQTEETVSNHTSSIEEINRQLVEIFQKLKELEPTS